MPRYVDVEVMKSTMDSILVDSFLHGTAIGIKLKGNSALIATAVTNLSRVDNNDHWIEIKPLTLYGHPVAETIIYKSQIESVIPFTVYYDDPLYVRLRELRAKIFNVS